MSDDSREMIHPGSLHIQMATGSKIWDGLLRQLVVELESGIFESMIYDTRVPLWLYRKGSR